MVINFITNQSLTEISGGWSGINKRLFEELSKYAIINYVYAGKTPVDLFQKIKSKILRLSGRKGDFYFFSDKRLSEVAVDISEKIKPADYNFFFGQTSWIRYHSPLPYGIYMDASFPTYMRVFSNPEEFRTDDLQRINHLEKEWLIKADHLFWGSDWCREEAIKQYSLEEMDQSTVWVGGNIPIPDELNFPGTLNFVFISLRFKEKGGFTALEAFRKVKQKYNEAKLQIIGQEPPKEVLAENGVEYLGFLDKSIVVEREKFSEILNNAFLLVHPTIMDTMGAVIIEAGYYGCPAIAPRSFGIPELIRDSKTGFLLEVPFTADDFADRMLWLIEHPAEYREMRHKVRDHCISNLSYEVIGKKIFSKIQEAVQ